MSAKSQELCSELNCERQASQNSLNGRWCIYHDYDFFCGNCKEKVLVTDEDDLRNTFHMCGSCLSKELQKYK